MTWWFWLAASIILLFGFVVFFGAPYVPSKKRDLRQAFEKLYALNEKDVLVDVGSGDGVVLRMAAEKGARAVGYELNPVLVALSRFFSRRYKKIEVHFANFWRVHLPADTTVIYVFATTRDTDKLARKIQREVDRIGHGVAVITYGAAVPHRTSLNKIGAHNLYNFSPLQVKET